MSLSNQSTQTSLRPAPGQVVQTGSFCSRRDTSGLKPRLSQSKYQRHSPIQPLRAPVFAEHQLPRASLSSPGASRLRTQDLKSWHRVNFHLCILRGRGKEGRQGQSISDSLGGTHNPRVNSSSQLQLLHEIKALIHSPTTSMFPVENSLPALQL